GRPISTPVPMNVPRYAEISHPPPIPQSSARRGNMFGPYLLLQTLGEGEFGKVKLGIHVDTGEEVAIKLIRKESVDTPSRLTKIEREIGVLRRVMHPNIVKLYDVFETDRYIGIIMEYASGGELFDHILAHRYLKERDACRLFAQLISGVDYLHKKNIVHRDLKLENLLLNRNRNIIITDFGFANQFNGAHDDLMATSCGSPCYAAPELVISEGLYVGSAVDIWSCGVILYAMLSGYLPFDDDPSNPDGDNINLLYKYIINTPLVFPEYVSPDARDLLKKMLVPDPAKRCDMKTIMSHRWLAPYASIFNYSIQELEAAADPVPSLAPPEAYLPSASSNFLNVEYVGNQQNVAPGTTTVKRHTIQVEYSDNNAKYVDYPDEDFQFVDGTRLGSNFVPVATSDMILPEERDELLQADSNVDCNITENTSSLSSQNIDPLGAHPKTEKHHSTTSTASGYSDKSSTAKNSTTAGSSLLTLYERDTDNTTNDLRDNLVLSKSNSKDLKTLEQQQKSSSQTPKKRDAPRTRPVTVHGPPSIPLVLHHNENQSKNSAISDKSHRPSEKIPSLPQFSSPPPSIPLPPIPSHHESPIPPPPSVVQKRHKKSISSERIQNPMGIKQSRVENGNAISTTGNYGGVDSGKLSVHQSLQPSHVTELPSDTASDTSYVDENVLDDTKKGRNGKRKALSLMVDTFKGSAANSTHSVVSNNNVQVKDKRKTVSGTSAGSSNAAKRVMDWFRRKSLAKPEVPVLDVPSELAKVEEPVMTTNAPQSKSKAKRPKNNPSVIVTQPSSSTVSQTSSRQSTMTSSSTVDLKLRVHHGAVDQNALTSRPPYEVFIVVKQTLLSMGIEIKRESEFKVRCVRRKRKQIDNTKSSSNSKDSNKSQKNKDTLTVSENSETSIDTLAEKKRRKYAAGPLKSFLRRTNSHNVSSSGITPTSSQTNSKSSDTEMSAVDNNNSSINGDSLSVPNSPTMGPLMTLTGPDNSSPENVLQTSALAPEILYGDPSIDSGEEIRFAVELCRLKNLPGIYIVDIKRMKGNLWAYKFIYHTLFDKLDLKGKGGYLTIGTSGGMIP
ncbi:12052_t:CDS:2, partial [Acaulospora morrowiae]